MIKWMAKRSVLCGLLMCFSLSGQNVWADSNKAFQGFEFFPGGVLLFEARSEAPGYRLPLGTLKRKDGRLQPEFEKKLDAEVRQFTWEISRNVSPLEIYKYYQQMFSDEAYEVLYRCKSRACGSNSHWANQIFEQRVLNGLVDSQRYMAVKAPDDALFDYVVFYLIQRGNKKSYTRIEFIKAGDERGASEALLASLNKKGFVTLTELVFTARGEIDRQLSSSTVEQMLELLRGNPELSFAIVGHTVLAADIDKAVMQSEMLAKRLLTLLNEQKTNTNLHAYGVGPLAPRDLPIKSGNSWLELVLMRD